MTSVAPTDATSIVDLRVDDHADDHPIADVPQVQPADLEADEVPDRPDAPATPDEVIDPADAPAPDEVTDPADPPAITAPAVEDVSAANGSSSSAFSGLGLRPELLAVLDELGYEEPTPIQTQTIPTLLSGRDVLGQAATGTGKTAAFALPILQSMPESPHGNAPMALVLVPTRELAIQVADAVHRYGRTLGVRVLPIYGGQPIGRQLQALARGVDVVVATPGRAVDHLNRKTLSLAGLRMVVLDEADEMLDMGFAEDIDAILGATPESRQTVLFSATLPSRIDAIARRHQHKPVRIQATTEKAASNEAPLVSQRAYVVGRAHKAAAIGRVLDVETPAAALVFCRTRDEVDRLTETLNGRGYRAEALHGGMNQEQRDRVMGRIRKETADLLIATDVAARGLDIDHLTHVINYNVPSAPESYVHRIGRVGRAGRAGVAITLTEPREHRMLKTIERVTKQHITVATLPSVADLRSRRLERTRSALQAELQRDSEALEAFRVVVEALSDEFDVMEVALAAVKLAHEASAPAAADEEIPTSQIDASRPAGSRKDGFGKGGTGKGRPAGKSGPMSRIFIGAGREARIRPQDLVGAIANESSLSGRDIGHIDISDRHSLVEVPRPAVDEVIKALRNTTVKGRKVTVRREHQTAP